MITKKKKTFMPSSRHYSAKKSSLIYRFCFPTLIII